MFIELNAKCVRYVIEKNEVDDFSKYIDVNTMPSSKKDYKIRERKLENFVYTTIAIIFDILMESTQGHDESTDDPQKMARDSFAMLSFTVLYRITELSIINEKAQIIVEKGVKKDSNEISSIIIYFTNDIVPTKEIAKQAQNPLMKLKIRFNDIDFSDPFDFVDHPAFCAMVDKKDKLKDGDIQDEEKNLEKIFDLFDELKEASEEYEDGEYEEYDDEDEESEEVDESEWEKANSDKYISRLFEKERFYRLKYIQDAFKYNVKGTLVENDGKYYIKTNNFRLGEFLDEEHIYRYDEICDMSKLIEAEKTRKVVRK